MKFKLIFGSLFALVLFITFSILYRNNKELNRQLECYKINEKALISESDSVKNKSRVYKLTIEQLNYFNDSISDKLNKVLKENDINRSKLKELDYYKSISSKKDTITLKDTVFVEGFKLDSIVGDKWFNVRLQLEYPNKIGITPTYVNETFAIITSKKETINPPKRFFLLRWFQKKHEVLEVEVIESNPYAKTKEQRFIQIIK